MQHGNELFLSRHTKVRTEEQLVEVNTTTTGAYTRLIVCQINIVIGRDFETDGRAEIFDQYGNHKMKIFNDKE
nr:hypothetical protein [Tanacetum cinerariifolium]